MLYILIHLPLKPTLITSAEMANRFHLVRPLWLAGVAPQNLCWEGFWCHNQLTGKQCRYWLPVTLCEQEARVFCIHLLEIKPFLIDNEIKIFKWFEFVKINFTQNYRSTSILCNVSTGPWRESIRRVSQESKLLLIFILILCSFYSQGGRRFSLFLPDVPPT